jgi:glycosyltransferase involved in cell wall biosynthesis
MTAALTSPPLVSVILPTWNREQYIVEAIDSVLQQDYRNIELLVIDDGSTDSTISAIRATHDPRLRLIQQANAGAARARNNGLRQAQGAFVAFLDADDRWKPGKLRRQMDLFTQHPTLTLVSARGELIDHVGQLLGDVTDSGRGSRYNRGRDWHHDLLMRGNAIVMSSVVVRRDAALAVGGFFDERRIVSHDYELWIRLSEGRQFWVSTEVLVSYRVLNDSLLHSATTAKEYSAQLGIIRMHRARFSALQWRRRMATLYRDWADSAEYLGEAEASQYLRSSLRHYPFDQRTWMLGGRMLWRRARRHSLRREQPPCVG